MHERGERSLGGACPGGDAPSCWLSSCRSARRRGWWGGPQLVILNTIIHFRELEAVVRQQGIPPVTASRCFPSGTLPVPARRVGHLILRSVLRWGIPSWGTPAAAGARPGRPPMLTPRPASGWRRGCAPGPDGPAAPAGGCSSAMPAALNASAHPSTAGAVALARVLRNESALPLKERFKPDQRLGTLVASSIVRSVEG